MDYLISVSKSLYNTFTEFLPSSARIPYSIIHDGVEFTNYNNMSFSLLYTRNSFGLLKTA
jgi:hypothetical protein